MVKFEVHAEVDNILKCFSVKNTEVITMHEPPNLTARNTLRHVCVMQFHFVVKSCFVLGGAAYCKQVHFLAKSNKLDNWIAHCIICKVADFGAMDIGFRTAELK